VTGGILGSLGGLLTALLVTRCYVRSRLLGSFALSRRELLAGTMAPFVAGVGVQLFIRVDLLVVKALSDTAESAGLYGAAQSLMLGLSILVAAASPVLLATLTRTLQQGDQEGARLVASQAIRLVLLATPLAGAILGSGWEIAALLFGPRFAPAGPQVGMLVFAGLGVVMISVTTAILYAIGGPERLLWLLGSLPLVASLCHLAVVPVWGAVAAAICTAVLSWLAAGTLMRGVYLRAHITPTRTTFLRSGVATLASFLLSVLWPSTGAWVLVEMVTVAGAALALLTGLGELTGKDLEFVRSMLPLLRSRRRAFGTPE
jgi:O-antigen/teichoic acid export membrane protein